MIYAWDRDADTRRALLAAYPDRPVWLVAGPTGETDHFVILRGPGCRPIASLDLHEAAPSDLTAVPELQTYRRFMRRIIDEYDSLLVRAYCTGRFQIIRLDMLHILRICLRGKRRVMEVDCGFGLFGCYFAASDSRRRWLGFDLSAGRVEMAQRAAQDSALRTLAYWVAAFEHGWKASSTPC